MKTISLTQSELQELLDALYFAQNVAGAFGERVEAIRMNASIAHLLTIVEGAAR